MVAAISDSKDRRRTFCTLFHVGNDHLTKDVGLIPYGMHRYFNYDAYIATYIDGEYPSLDCVPGLHLVEIPKISGDYFQDSCRWLARNAAEIDVLNIYHLYRRSLRQGIIYKRLNPNGKIYLKCDGCPMPPRYADSRSPWSHWWRMARSFVLGPTYPYKRLLEWSFVSTEIKDNVQRLSALWRSEIGYVPNPFHPNEQREFRPYAERDNVILTVGRLGTRQKATEILLEAFAKIEQKIPGWQLKLVGPFQENVNICEDFFHRYPYLDERVVFVGPIDNREALIDIYRNAKIFAFPSRFESFGIALMEAMLHGDFVIATKIPEFEALTDHFAYALGNDIDDVDALAANLLFACTHPNEIEPLGRRGYEKTAERFKLENVCHAIESGLGFI